MSTDDIKAMELVAIDERNSSKEDSLDGNRAAVKSTSDRNRDDPAPTHKNGFEVSIAFHYTFQTPHSSSHSHHRVARSRDTGSRSLRNSKALLDWIRLD
jgi:hypothetical protein